MAKKSKELFAQRQLAVQRVLKSIRVERGLKQIQVCDLLGRGRNYVMLVETGQRRCSVPEFLEFVEGLGADPMEALGRVVKWKEVK